jgi:hypothetical protein
MSVTVGGKQYEYKKATLGLMRRMAPLEKTLRSVAAALEDSEKWAEFEKTWKAYVSMILVSPGDLLNVEDLDFEDIGKVQRGFFGQAEVTPPKSDDGKKTSPGSIKPV